MTNGEVFFMLIFVVAVLSVCLARVISMQSKPDSKEPQTEEPPKPRITLPTDCDIYSFSINSQLKPEEWQMILNAGWSLLTCTTEQYVDYAGSYPEAPRYHRTRWNYTFRRTRFVEDTHRVPIKVIKEGSSKEKFV